MLARTHLIRIQKSIYDRLRGSARYSVGGLSVELKEYFNEYQRDFQTFQKFSEKKELLLAMQKAPLVLCGDYHTLPQAQRTVLRLLTELLPKIRASKRRPVLALEMLRPRDEEAARQYLAGTLSEAEFLVEIDFEKNWGFQWENYRPLFEFARTQKIDLVGINTQKKRGGSAGLKERDRFAAHVLTQTLLRERKIWCLVLIGDLHLARTHLPRQLKMQFQKFNQTKRTVIVHQNNERLYWKLVEKGIEHKTHLVQMKKDIFCILNTPPWIKLQSHLKWLEFQTQEEGEAGPALDPEIFSLVNYHEELLDILKILQEFLGIEIPGGEDFALRGPSIPAMMAELRRSKRYSAREMKTLACYLGEFESAYLARGKIIFLKSLNLNHLAYQAALFLHANLVNFNHVVVAPDSNFYSFVWFEALGYFGSKLINPKRPFYGPVDLKNRLSALRKNRVVSKNMDQQVAAWTLERWEAEEGVSPFILPVLKFPKLSSGARPKLFYAKSAKLLGKYLGQRIYLALLDGKIDRTEVKTLFSTPFTQKRARQLYQIWTKKLLAMGYQNVNYSV